MIVLLIVFAASFASLMIYGEVWRIRLSTADVHVESFDRGQTQNAFIMSCICIASGASMLYIIEKEMHSPKDYANKLDQRL
jgi:hypothetical protein